MNVDSPLVSIIIPLYNLGPYLDEAVASVLNQTYRNFEILVVNDGSTDKNTLTILKQLKKKYLGKVQFIDQKNQGLPSARNNGISMAKGKYICCLDADDKYNEEFIEKAVKELERNKDAAIATTWLEYFGTYQDIWQASDYNPARLLVQNSVHVASLFRKSAWQEVGGYSVYMDKGYEDWEFWIKIVSKGHRWVTIHEPLFYYRVRSDSMITHSNQVRESLIEKIITNNKQFYLENLTKIIELINTSFSIQPYFASKKKGANAEIAYLKQTVLALQKDVNRILSTRGWRTLEKLRIMKKFLSKYRPFRLLFWIIKLPTKIENKDSYGIIRSLHRTTSLYWDKYILSHSNLARKETKGSDILTSICILVLDRHKDLERLLKTIKIYTKDYQYEILILDQNSTIKTKNYLKSLKDKNVKVFYSKKNLGCSGGRKYLINKAKGDYIVQLDNDIEVTKDWLKNLINSISWDDKIAGACGRVVFPNNKLEYNGGYYKISGSNIYFYRKDNQKIESNRSFFMETYCDWIPGGASIFKRKAFSDENYDEGYLNGWGDNDLSFRMASHGWKFVNCPTSKLIHHHRSFVSSQTMRSEKEYLKFRNNFERSKKSYLRFYEKHGLIIANDNLPAYFGLPINRDFVGRVFTRLKSLAKRIIFGLASKKDTNKYIRYSIMLSTYNYEKYLPKCLETVKSQTYKNYELVIIDDHSTDRTPKIIRKFIEDNDEIQIKYIRHTKNAGIPGISKSLNEAIMHTSGDYVVFLDSDDLLLPQSLYEVNKVLSKTQYDYVSTQIIDIDADDNILQFRPRTEKVHDLFKGMYAGHLKVVKRSLFSRIGYMNSDVSGAQDYDFVLRALIKDGSIFFLQKYLYKYRWHSKTTSVSQKDEQDRRTDLIQRRAVYHKSLIDYTAQKHTLMPIYIVNKLTNKVRKDFPFEVRFVKSEKQIQGSDPSFSKFIVANLNDQDLDQFKNEVIDLYNELTKPESNVSIIALDQWGSYEDNLRQSRYVNWNKIPSKTTKAKKILQLKSF